MFNNLHDLNYCYIQKLGLPTIPKILKAKNYKTTKKINFNTKLYKLKHKQK